MSPAKRQSVLVVEDERIVAEDLQQTLLGLGYDAFAIASSADEAIRYASERCPDLVLMDIRIKGVIDGIATAEILRDRFRVPVVYLTAYADQATIGRAKATEPYGYLTKPVRRAELASTIEVALHRHDAERQARQREAAEQRRLQEQLELADRMVSLGTMAAGVAHEINNPLAVIVANAEFVALELGRRRSELLGRGSAEEGLRGLDEAIQAQGELQLAAKRIGRIVSDLRAFARPEEQAPGEIHVGRCIEWAIRSTAHELRHRARVATDLHPVPAVAGDETRLGQVFVNLLVNAAQAIPPGDPEHNEVRITLRADDGGRIVTEIRDTGDGMPADVVSRIFDPFFTTKPAGVGTGLGLSICRGIVTSLGGDLAVETRVGEGTCFRLRLPAAPRPPRAEVAEPPRPAPAARRGRILVVDDEDPMLRAIRRTLDEHDLVCTTRAREAIQMIQRGERFDLIFSDVVMPEMTGIDFYEALLRDHPEDARRVVFLTGGAITEKVDDFLRAIPNQRVEKPFDVDALRKLVRELLGAKEGAARS